MYYLQNNSPLISYDQFLLLLRSYRGSVVLLNNIIRDMGLLIELILCKNG